jgi:eukaryotic-like serine/threonine-protein kinase
MSEATLNGQRIGPYRILDVLGRGGMGVVYRAEHRDTGEAVALKTVQAPDKEVLQSLRREIHALACIRHPGVVRILAEGMHEGLPWYAMELLAGVSLDRHAMRPGEQGAAHAPFSARTARRPGPAALGSGDELGWWTDTLVELGLGIEAEGTVLEAGDGMWGLDVRSPLLDPAARREALGIVRRICAPLAFLHGEGIVHRDLKPANIVLIREPGYERLAASARQDERSASSRPGACCSLATPVLVDFGLTVRFTDSVSREALEVEGGPVGTVAYMAPEQIRGELVDARADLYSLGCILYFLLTGREPFVGRTIAEVAEAHLSSEPEPPSGHVPGLEPELDALVLGLLAKHPRERIGHADDVSMALGRLGAEDDPAAALLPRPRAYLYRPGLFGREGQLTELERHLTRLELGTGGFLLVEGESGAGKTRLALEAARMAEKRRLLVLAGQCLPEAGAGSAAAGALHALARPLQAIADRCRSLGRRETERLLGRRGRVLALYAPALADLQGMDEQPEPAELPADAARLRLFAYLSETLAALAASAPVLLMLDDLHLADELTLGFLDGHLRRVLAAGAGAQPPARVLILGTYRSEEAGAALLELRARLSESVVTLERLGERAVGAMVGDMLALAPPPAALVHFLARQSEGNPFFVAEYLRMALAEGLLGRDAEGRWHVQAAGRRPQAAGGGQADPDLPPGYESLPLPGSLRELVHRRLQGLPGRELALTRAAAVAGRETRISLLAAMARLPEDGLLESISELARRQVLEPVSGRRLRFVHDPIREAAYEGIEGPERRALHRRAAEALVAEAPSSEGFAALAALGDHWCAAGEPALARAPYLEAARRAAAVYAHGQAERLYGAFLRLPGGPSVDTALARIELSRRVLSVQGRGEEALEESRRALAEARALGDRPAEGASLREIGSVLLDEGRAEAARELFEQALAVHREVGNRQGEGDTLDNLANCHWQLGRLNEAGQLFEVALQVHREIDNRRSEASTLNNLAGIWWQRGGLEQARALGRQARSLFRSLGERRLEGASLSNLAWLQQASGQPAEAEQLYEQALAIHREVGDRRSEPHTLHEMATLCRRMREDLEGALSYIEQAEQIALASGDRPVLCRCLCERGHHELARGGDGRQWLERAEALATELGSERVGPLGRTLARLRRAVDAAAEGHPLFRGECESDLPEGMRSEE